MAQDPNTGTFARIGLHDWVELRDVLTFGGPRAKCTILATARGRVVGLEPDSAKVQFCEMPGVEVLVPMAKLELGRKGI